MDAAAILKATTGHDAMIASDTRRRVLDAVDTNFDAQLATTADFLAIPSTRGADKGLHGFFGEADDPAGRELAHENDMANNEVVATTAMTRDVIAGLDEAIHLPRKMLCRSLMDTRVPNTPTAFVRRRTSAARRLRRALGARPPKLFSEGGKPAYDNCRLTGEDGRS
jgi:hypothetical protein